MSARKQSCLSVSDLQQKIRVKTIWIMVFQFQPYLYWHCGYEILTCLLLSKAVWKVGPASLAMAVAEYENFKLALISLRVTSLETVKLSKKSKTRIREAFAVVILKHLQGQKDDITIESHVTRCGNGAFKDVFMCDSCNLVLKIMTKEKNEASWPGNATQEQKQFDLYRDTASSLMMTCLGQVYVDIAPTSPTSDIYSKGCILEGDEATSNAIASITLAEKLFQTGTTKLRSTCMTLPCARHTWHVLADDYMGLQTR